MNKAKEGIWEPLPYTHHYVVCIQLYYYFFFFCFAMHRASELMHLISLHLFVLAMNAHVTTNRMNL